MGGAAALSGGACWLSAGEDWARSAAAWAAGAVASAAEAWAADAIAPAAFGACTKGDRGVGGLESELLLELPVAISYELVCILWLRVRLLVCRGG